MTKIPGKDNPAADNDEIGGAVPLLGSLEQGQTEGDAAFRALQFQVSSDVGDATADNDRLQAAIPQVMQSPLRQPTQSPISPEFLAKKPLDRTINGQQISFHSDGISYYLTLPGIHKGSQRSKESGVWEQQMYLPRATPQILQYALELAVTLAENGFDSYVIFNAIKALELGNLPEPDYAEEDLAVDKTYRAQETVNGHKISVAYDEKYDCYTIYFPELQLGTDEAEKFDVVDSIIALDKDRLRAMNVFGYAKREAGRVRNPYFLYRSVKAFAYPESA